MDWKTVYYRLKALSVYRKLLEEPVMAALMRVMDCVLRQDVDGFLTANGELRLHLAREGVFELGPWLSSHLLYCDNPWGKALESGQESVTLDAYAAYDLETFRLLSEVHLIDLYTEAESFLPPEAHAAANALVALRNGLPLLPAKMETWKEIYTRDGYGPFARYRAFLWDDGELLPIAAPDVPAQADLIGYRLQRQQVEDNTYALLAGNRVNNVLLFGDSGTGKSATVKSLLGLPGTEDLRLIEIEKNSVAQLPKLIRSLAGKRQKFILFLDDLAFDEDDMTYSVLKTILEGGLEPRPANVAIYATSNRRNLVRQTFSSRAGDEVDREETIQEKTALADRFGLRIPYLGLAKTEYLELVDHLAAQAGLTLPQEELHAKAIRWDARHPGRSPRTAQQFIASLM